MDDRPRYMISVAADIVGMHPQTLRIYENKGLVRPGRTGGGTRLYSERDLDRLRLIQRLTTELGLNLAGVERVLALEDELQRMRARLERLRLIQRLTTELGLNLAGVERVLALEDELQRMRARLDRLQREMRDAVAAVHKTYRRDLVPVTQTTTVVHRRRA